MANTVELVVGARDDGASADLDKLKLRLDEIGRKAETAKVNLKGGKEAELALARLQLRLDTLSKKVSSPRIRIDGVRRAEVDLLAIDVAMDRLKTKSSGGFLSGLSGLMGNLAGKTGEAAKSAGLFAGKWAAIGGGIATVGAPLAAVTASVAALGIVAAPTLSKLKTGLTAVSQATDQYSAASLRLTEAVQQSPANMKAYQASLKGLEPDLRTAAQLLTNQSVTWQKLSGPQAASVVALSENKKALAGLLPDQRAALTALMAQRNAWNALSPAQHEAATSIQGLQAAFGKLATSFEPLILKLVQMGSTLATHLMPALGALASAGGKVLISLLKPLDQLVRSNAFTKLIQEMAQFAVQAAKAFAPQLVKILQQVLELIVQLAPAGMKIDLAMLKMTAAILPLIGALLRLAGPVITHVVVPAVNFLANVISRMSAPLNNLGATWRRVWGDIKAATSDAANWIGQQVSRIEGFLASVNNALGGIPGRVLSAIGFASGGIVGAASGGVRSGMVMVGERGRELVQLPAGSRVYNNSQTESMMSGGGGGVAQVDIVIHAGDGNVRDFLQRVIRVSGGDPAVLTRKVRFA